MAKSFYDDYKRRQKEKKLPEPIGMDFLKAEAEKRRKVATVNDLHANENVRETTAAQRAQTVQTVNEQHAKEETRAAKPTRKEPVAAVNSMHAREDVRPVGMERLLSNQLKWHQTQDETKRARLHAENDALRAQYGLSYDDYTGRTTGPDGKNYSEITEQAYAKPVQQLNARIKNTVLPRPEVLAYYQSQPKSAPAPNPVKRLGMALDSANQSVTGGLTAAFQTSEASAEAKREQRYLEGKPFTALDEIYFLEYPGSKAAFIKRMDEKKRTLASQDQASIQAMMQRDAYSNELMYGDGSRQLRAAQELQARAKQETGVIGGGLLDVVNMGGQMLANAAIASTGGGGPKLFTGLSSYQQAGQASEQAKQLGADPQTQANFGAAVGLANAGIESLGGIGGAGIMERFGSKLLPRGAQAFMNRIGQTAAGQVLGNAAEEAFQNAVQYDVNRRLGNAILKTDEKFDPAQMGSEALAGGIMGGLVGGARAIGDRVVNGPKPYGYDALQRATDVQQPRPEGTQRLVSEVVADQSANLNGLRSDPVGDFLGGGNLTPRQLSQLLSDPAALKQLSAAGVDVADFLDAAQMPKSAEYDTLSAHTRNAQLEQARAVAGRLGAKLNIKDLGKISGKYQNGTITINPNTDSPIQQVLIHELTHHLETSGQYSALRDKALSLFAAELNMSVAQLSDNVAARELVSIYCEHRLFQDADSITELARTDRTLFERIRQWISDTMIRLRGTEQEKQMLEIHQLYERAAKSVGEQAGFDGRSIK